MLNIKESNYWAIRDFAILGDNSRIQGTKLNALFNLVQKKGEPMQTENKKLKGVKVINYGKGEYIGFIHTPFKDKNFFPCKLQTVSLTELAPGE